MTDRFYGFDTPTATHEFTPDMLREKLLGYVKNGMVGDDDRGMVLGIIGSINRGRVSPKQMTLARRIVYETRYTVEVAGPSIDADDAWPPGAQWWAVGGGRWREAAVEAERQASWDEF